MSRSTLEDLQCFSAAKNHKDVTVICDPADYSRVLKAMEVGLVETSFRQELALKVFTRTSSYDAIKGYLASHINSNELDMDSITGFPANCLEESKIKNLRYGENPHQQAALYGNFGLF